MSEDGIYIETETDEVAENLETAEIPAPIVEDCADSRQSDEEAARSDSSAADDKSPSPALFAPKTPYETAIADYLTETASDALKAKIREAAAAGYGIADCMAYITEEARKDANGAGCAMIRDEVVYGWAVHYFEDEWREAEERKRKEAEEAERRKAEVEKDEEERLAAMTAEERLAYQREKARKEAEEAERKAAAKKAADKLKAKREAQEAKRKAAAERKAKAEELAKAQMTFF